MRALVAAIVSIPLITGTASAAAYHYSTAEEAPPAPSVTVAAPEPVEKPFVRTPEAQAALDAYNEDLANPEPIEPQQMTTGVSLGPGFGYFDRDFANFMNAAWAQGLLTPAQAKAALDEWTGGFHNGWRSGLVDPSGGLRPVGYTNTWDEGMVFITSHTDATFTGATWIQSKRFKVTDYTVQPWAVAGSKDVHIEFVVGHDTTAGEHYSLHRYTYTVEPRGPQGYVVTPQGYRRLTGLDGADRNDWPA